MLGENELKQISLSGDEISRFLIQRILPLYGDPTDYKDSKEYPLKALERIKNLQYKISDLTNRKYIISQQNLLRVIAGHVKDHRFVGKLGPTEKRFLLLLCKGPQEKWFLVHKLKQTNKKTLAVMKMKIQKKLMDRHMDTYVSICNVIVKNNKRGYELIIDPKKIQKILEKHPEIYEYWQYDYKISD